MSMIKEYQVTLICESGQYRPVSCVVKRDDEEIITLGLKEFMRKVKSDGIKKICNKRGWTAAELRRYYYTKIKAREYNKELIEAEKIEKYEAIKKAKYASGEWKPSKKELARG